MTWIGSLFKTITWLPKVIASTYRAVKWCQQKDAEGVRFLSDAFFAEARKAAEVKVLDLVDGQDKGIRGLFDTDNQILRGCGIFLKSDAILDVCVAKDSEKAGARQKVREKDAKKSVQQWSEKAAAVYPVH